MHHDVHADPGRRRRRARGQHRDRDRHPADGADAVDGDRLDRHADRLAPAITLDKQAGTPSANTAGSTIAYSFVVTNTGNVTLTSVGVSDPKVGPVTCPATTLAPGASTTCTATYTLTQADVDAGPWPTPRPRPGTPPAGLTAPTASDSTDTPIAARPGDHPGQAGRDPEWQHGGLDDRLHVHRDQHRERDPHRGRVTDPKVGTVSCPASTLAAGASTTCTKTYTLTQADVDAGIVNNTATASGTPPAGPAGDRRPTPRPRRSRGPRRSRWTSRRARRRATRRVSTIAYSFVVTNTGNVTLTSVGRERPEGRARSAARSTTLAPGASTTCTATYTLTQADVDAGHVANTATAPGRRRPA